jgi:cytochrome c oxidase assembly protein subunit 15
MDPHKSQIAFQPKLHLFAFVTASCTFLLLIAGALVVGTGSAKAVPDWPLSFGQFFPPMKGGVLFEHGHRLVAGIVGLLILSLSFALQKWEQRRWVKVLAWCALGIVGLQSVLGGILILYGLPLGVSVFHSGLGPAFFCLTVVLALVTSRQWMENHPVESSTAKLSLSTWALIATTTVFIEILIGALVRYSGAGLTQTDYSVGLSRLVYNGWSLPLIAGLCHRLWGVLVLILVSYVYFLVRRGHSGHRSLNGPAKLAVFLVWVQLFLGVMVVLTRLGIEPTTLHIVLGSAILASMLVLTLNSYRISNPA